MKRIAMVLGPLAFLACDDDCDDDNDEHNNDPVLPPYEYTGELTDIPKSEWVVVGRAPFSLATKYTGSEDMGNDSYKLTFHDKVGGYREITAVKDGDVYKGTMFVQGHPFAIEYDAVSDTLNVDANGDGLFEDRDTLERLLSRAETKSVAVGQHFLVEDKDGQETLSYEAYTPWCVVFNHQNYLGARQISLAVRADGALGGSMVLNGVAYEFAMLPSGALVIDRDDDGCLEGFVSQGLPTHGYARAFALAEGEQHVSTIGSSNYMIEPILINETAGSAILRIGQEITPALYAGDLYDCFTGPNVQVHDVLKSPSIVTFAVRAD